VAEETGKNQAAATETVKISGDCKGTKGVIHK